MSFQPSPSGLLLPTHLRRDRDQAAQRAEQGRTFTNPNGTEVSCRHVDMGRKGWRHEVAATYDTRDDYGPVRRQDVLWLEREDDAMQLARAAADLLGHGNTVGLSEIARRLRLQLARA